MISTCRCDTAEGPGAGGVVLLLAGFAVAVGAPAARPPSRRRWK